MNHKLPGIATLLTLAIFLRPQELAAQPTAPQQSAQQSSPASVKPPVPAIPVYPDSPEGLEHLMKDMLKLEKKGDAKDLAPYVQSLILPNPSVWFTATFGEKIGAALTDAYDRTRMDLPLSFPDTLAQIQSRHLTDVQATLFTDSCNQESSNTEYRLLTSRTQEQPVYHVRLRSSTQAAVLGFFVFVDGAFRYIGDFQISTPRLLNAGGKIMAAKEIYAPQPQYPAYARDTHVSGTVVIHAIIGPNGNVCSLQLVSGPLALAGASLDAVRKWRYSPSTVNGNPVSVDTTITVVFTLGN